MHRPFAFLLTCALFVGWVPRTFAEDHKLVIRPVADAPWGGQIADVQKVLDSAANQLWPYFSDRKLPTILVEPKGGPITLYQRGPAGEIRVRLNTGDRLWAQHAFQFAHEFGHILCNYDPAPNRNKWFEESICEAASLFALRRMAKVWERDPPYPNWKSYAPSLASYAEDRMKNSQLPDGASLAAWYREHADSLYRDPVMREKNLIVATALLPLFEKEPEHWASVAYLNVTAPRESQTFSTYLAEWHTRCPAKHRPFVATIARQFELPVAD